MCGVAGEAGGENYLGGFLFSGGLTAHVFSAAGWSLMCFSGGPTAYDFSGGMTAIHHPYIYPTVFLSIHRTRAW